MACPKCGSNNTRIMNITKYKEFDVKRGWSGLAFGALGLLCGFCTMEQEERLMWVCGDCGAHFR